MPTNKQLAWVLLGIHIDPMLRSKYEQATELTEKVEQHPLDYDNTHRNVRRLTSFEPIHSGTCQQL